MFSGIFVQRLQRFVFNNFFKIIIRQIAIYIFALTRQRRLLNMLPYRIGISTIHIHFIAHGHRKIIGRVGRKH